MYYNKRTLILTAVLATLFGTAQHFFYHWLPNFLTALVSPVNESLWEHSKLIFIPYLLGALFLNRDRPGGLRPWVLTLPLLIAWMLILGWLYNVVLSGEWDWINILIYLLIMSLGFWLPTRFLHPIPNSLWYPVLAGVILLGVALVVFTFYPPNQILFWDLSIARAWFSSPCRYFDNLLQ